MTTTSNVGRSGKLQASSACETMMLEPSPPSWLTRLWRLLIGSARSPLDHKVFHQLSLIAFFAWVGLGADGLSSSAYGPEEAYKAMGAYPYLAIFVAIATAVTVLIISASYIQIIEQFPSGGGGYVVASKLLSPSLGMVSGCALLLDYVLTIAISIASGADALFSFLPESFRIISLPMGMGEVSGKMLFVVMGIMFMTLLNLRGVRESVGPLVPIFVVFILTHTIVVATTLFTKVANLPEVVRHTTSDLQDATAALGYFGVFALLMKAYSMGAGTYTGIEAVSNGLPILREPRAETGKRTMRYMAASLALVVFGLMMAYLLFKVQPEEGKTLNAVLFKAFTANWPEPWGDVFVWVILLSQAAILFVAAQAGFLGGPRVLSNMAQDRWMPHKFATLSDRLVTQNGVLLMSGSALIVLLFTSGSVAFLVVLYAINVFLTFCLSQLGMVVYWWRERQRMPTKWRKGMLINGVGLLLCFFILISVTITKFHEGGWLTIFITGAVVVLAIFIRRHYEHTRRLLRRLDGLVRAAEMSPPMTLDESAPQFDPNAKTAVLLVNGFNGLGLHTLLNIIRLFGNLYKNFVFVHIGIIDAGNFKGVEEIENLKAHINAESAKYVEFIKKQGYYGEARTALGTDVIQEVATLAPDILERFPQSVFFGGQLVFPKETLLSRWLHNYTVFALQRRFYLQGIPVVVLPIRV